VEASGHRRDGARRQVSELTPLAWRLRRCLLSIERERIQLAEIWTCFLGSAPELLHATDRRRQLRRALDELHHVTWLALPDDPRDWDRGDPPLPRRIEVLPASERARRLGAARAEAWHPELAWAADMELPAGQLADLRRINRWIVDERATAVIVPPRERSLQLFGAGCEDRLHELVATELFGPERLTWELLSCVPVPPPFVWSSVGTGSLLLVVSGHETFASIRRVLVESPTGTVGIVAHGAGAYFSASVPFARTLDRTIERILYYGDLDANDLDTALRADQRAVAAALPPVEPAAALYDLLLAHGVPSPAPPQPIEQARRLARWLPARVRDTAIRLLAGGRRLTQEWVGYERLREARIWERLGQS
jgi:hypothetical protein